MIKKWFLMATMLVGLSFGAFAQKYASVNTEYIMKNIPDYAQALAQLEKQSSDWQKELEAKFAEIDKMYKTYQQEAYLLPDNLKRKREEEIIAKEKEVKDGEVIKDLNETHCQRKELCLCLRQIGIEYRPLRQLAL